MSNTNTLGYQITCLFNLFDDFHKILFLSLFQELFTVAESGFLMKAEWFEVLLWLVSIADVELKLLK